MSRFGLFFRLGWLVCWWGLGVQMAHADLHRFDGPQPGVQDQWVNQSPDPFSYTPFAPSFKARKRAYLEFSAGREKGLMGALARLKLGQPPMVDDADLKRRVAHVNTRVDTVDFEMTRLMLALYMDKTHARRLFTPAQRALVEKTVLDFKYWITEPGPDTMITWTENHMILFHSLEYLAGQYFPNATFTNNSKTGRWRMAHARPYILRWINLRARYGFSEWDSNVYYNEDMPALMNLVLFAEDPKIKTLATMAVDLMFLDITLDHFHGVYATSHGRTYAEHNKWPLRHSMATVYKILYGTGQFMNNDHFTGTPLSLSDYELPPAIEAIGQDSAATFWGREGQGISLEDALGPLKFNPENIDDLVHLWAFGAYTQPDTILATLNAADRWNLWKHPFFEDAAKAARAVPRDNRVKGMLRTVPIETMRTLLGSVNKVTFRTADYQLSSAQDYRKGEAANQHFVWQAALKPHTVVMVNNPGDLSDTKRAPAYWINDNRLPRTAQWRNVLVSLYNIGKKELAGERGLYLFTHAWFPKKDFDEVRDTGQWTFGRKGDAYIGLYASQPKTWITEGREKDREIVAEGDRVVWIAHLGRKAEDGTFEEFMARVSAASVVVGEAHDTVAYDAPGVGRLTLGWKEPFTVDGQAVPLSGFPHFDNPYVLKARGEASLRLEKNGHVLELDFEKALRVKN